MSITASQNPAYPAANHRVRIKLATTGGGNYVRVWCVDAPRGSQLRAPSSTALAEEKIFTGALTIKAHEGDVSSNADLSTPFDFEPDKSGKYVFKAQEYSKGASGYGGGYKGDPAGFAPETVVLTGESNPNYSTFSVVVGDRLEIKLGAGPDTATLVFWIWDEKIRPTTFDLHGEETPAIINPSSPKATAAAGDATIYAVTQLIAGLPGNDGVSVSDAIGTPATVASDIITKFNAHRTQAGRHAANDTENVISTSFASPTSPTAIIKACAEILRKLDQHMRNDRSDTTGNGTGSASYHSAADWTNLLIASPPGDLNGAMVAIADAWRAYEAHRQNGTIHSAVDSANTLSALYPMLVLHREWLNFCRKSDPTCPASANPGALRMVSTFGAKLTT